MSKEENTAAATSEETAAVAYPAGAKFEVTLEDGEKMYLRPMSRQVLSIVLGLVSPSSGQPDYIRAGEVIIENCAIKGAGDYDVIKRDEDLFVGACFTVYGLVNIKTGVLKKL
jgi:hypothetical protein